MFKIKTQMLKIGLFLNIMSLQGIGGHDSPQIFFFFLIRKLLASPGKVRELFLFCLHGLVFSVLLSEWLPLMARDPNLPCNLLHRWIEKRLIHSFPNGISVNVNVIVEYLT